jgi:hypothetical protein
MNDKNFKKDILWNQGNRLLKLDQKRDKNGNLYLIGDLGYNFKVTVREMMGDYNKGKWEIQLYPIKYSKIAQQQDIVEAKEVFKAKEIPASEVPGNDGDCPF